MTCVRQLSHLGAAHDAWDALQWLAVHQAVCGARIGQGVLKTLIFQARKRGYAEAMAHTQGRAISFYLRQGFE